jgi:outer membrane protein
MKGLLTMKTTRFYSMLAAIALAYAPAAYAEGPSFATVNIQKIMQESNAAKSVREQIDGKMKALQSELSKKDEQFQKEHQEIEKQRSALSKQAFEEKTRSFSTKVTSAQKEVQSKKAMLDNAFERAINDIQKAVTEIIAGMAKEKNFTVALPTSQILYADEKLDITSEVLTKLNQKLPKVDVKFEAVSEKK